MPEKENLIIVEYEPYYKPYSKTRPPKPIDYNKLVAFLDENVTIATISAYFNCSPQTIYNRFGDLIQQKKLDYEYKLRAKMNELAFAGSEKMLVHLSKTQIGFADAIPQPVIQDDNEGGAEFSVRAPQAPSEQPADENEED